MATINDITGDSIQTKIPSEAYRNNYDMIFGKKKKQEEQKEPKEVLDFDNNNKKENQ